MVIPLTLASRTIVVFKHSLVLLFTIKAWWSWWSPYWIALAALANLHESHLGVENQMYYTTTKTSTSQDEKPSWSWFEYWPSKMKEQAM